MDFGRAFLASLGASSLSERIASTVLTNAGSCSFCLFILSITVEVFGVAL